MILGRSQFNRKKVREYYDELDKLLSEYNDVVIKKVLDFDHPWVNEVIIQSCNSDVKRQRADDLHTGIFEIGGNFYYKLVDLHEPLIQYESDK